MNDSHSQRAAGLLLEHRQKPEGFWHWIFLGKPVSLIDANKFMLGAILDYQISAATAWDNGRRLVEDICPDPANVWKWVTSIPRDLWNAKWREFNLHRFPKAHERIWRIGKEIISVYDGDPRKIWEGQSPSEVLHRLHALKAGEQISRMIVGALIDTGKISGKADVKVDTHVRKVLGRIARGREFSLQETDEVLHLTRKMSPENPWYLDEQLYLLGKSICGASAPDCRKCYLGMECAYGRSAMVSSPHEQTIPIAVPARQAQIADDMQSVTASVTDSSEKRPKRHSRRQTMPDNATENNGIRSVDIEKLRKLFPPQEIVLKYSVPEGVTDPLDQLVTDNDEKCYVAKTPASYTGRQLSADEAADPGRVLFAALPVCIYSEAWWVAHRKGSSSSTQAVWKFALGRHGRPSYRSLWERDIIPSLFSIPYVQMVTIRQNPHMKERIGETTYSVMVFFQPGSVRIGANPHSVLDRRSLKGCTPEENLDLVYRKTGIRIRGRSED